MGEKKTIKISLSAFFLAISIMVIAVMGYFIYKFYNDKQEEMNKTIELQKQVNNLNGTINELQEKLNIITKNNIQESTKTTTNSMSEKAVNDLSGTYEWFNPDGEGIICTFNNGTFTEQSGWNYKGTYLISGNKVTLKTTEELDSNSKYVPISKETVEEWTIEDNKLIRVVKNDDGSTFTQILTKNNN